jgi:hypothetical protein
MALSSLDELQFNAASIFSWLALAVFFISSWSPFIAAYIFSWLAFITAFALF